MILQLYFHSKWFDMSQEWKKKIMTMGHRSERVEQVVERPGNDDDVVDVEPEGQHDGGHSNT